MDYTMAMNYIDEKTKLGSVPGLVNIEELLKRLGNPQNKIKCFHIAGTNGKGSVFAYVQEVLIRSGYRVGRYISPTVFDYRERFQINGNYISEEQFADILTRVSEVVDDMTEKNEYSPTAFEIETAVAFLFFYMENVDFALIECGMGGLLDATNVIDNPYATVFSSIGMDHMQFLGDTPAKIAEQKAGIIKKNGVCVSYPQTKEIKAVIDKRCRELEADIFYADTDELDVVKTDMSGSTFIYMGNSYEIGLIGEHQIKNAITAIKLFEILKEKRGLCLKKGSIRDGLKNTKWAGRMTVVSRNPLIIVDGAHNKDGWMALENSVNKYFKDRKPVYIMGVLKDKDYTLMIDILKDTMAAVVTVTPDTPRGLSNTILAQLISDCGIPVCCAQSADEALCEAKKRAGADGIIVVAGSLSFIGEYLEQSSEQL